jgi:hypothetical protein
MRAHSVRFASGRRSRRAPALATLSLLAFACGESSPTPASPDAAIGDQAPGSPATPSDGSDPNAPKPIVPSDAGTGADASEARDGGRDASSDAGRTDAGTRRTATWPVDNVGPGTCAAECEKVGYLGCKLGCPGFDAGAARYANGSRVALSACTDAPPDRNEGSRFSSQICCCETPYFRREGDASAPSNCNTVCAAHGLACAPEFTWDGRARSGAAMRAYYRSGNTATERFPPTCDALPTPSFQDRQYNFVLDSFTCACVDR